MGRPQRLELLGSGKPGTLPKKRRPYWEMPVKALVVVCHPAAYSFNHALAEAVRAAWTSAGCDVVFHDLYAEGFDPLLSASEARGTSTADKTVAAHIAELRACDLLAVIHPNCWGAPPAMMKGSIACSPRRSPTHSPKAWTAGRSDRPVADARGFDPEHGQHSGGT
jgi:NAD(P)H-dependent FMN reductase